MTDDFDIGEAVLFMKVGTHANEELDSIIERKRKEIADAGFAMWGYGGNTCHPKTMVRPFVEAHAGSGGPIRLVMERMTSRHFADQVRAESFSIDGITWQPVPEPIKVWGSRFALCISSLETADATLALGDTRVAVGNSRGRVGSSYIKGHVDKACLEVVADGEPGREVTISLVADLVEPYAVFLKN